MTGWLSAEQMFVVTFAYPNRGALFAPCDGTDRPNWKNNDNWLTDAPVHPGTTGIHFATPLA